MLIAPLPPPQPLLSPGVIAPEAAAPPGLHFEVVSPESGLVNAIVLQAGFMRAPAGSDQGVRLGLGLFSNVPADVPIHMIEVRSHDGTATPAASICLHFYGGAIIH